MASSNDVQVGVSFNMDDVNKGIAKIGSTVKNAASAMGNVGSAALTGIKNLAAGIGAASTAAAAGVAAIGKASISAYADYEQLTGGVETLFKDSADIVKEYAKNAYETAGMSANEYMETVTSFSASLVSSLGGDTEAAAKQADIAITDMSDNANKMGTSLESLQYAYAGFAKQNYTMLDNLKLGYGGTKEEMERLLKDAQAISGVEYDISNFSDVVSAIHVIQTEIGITGTTAEEANKTIEGSSRAVKAAWENLLVGFADENQDVGELFNKLIERVNIFLDNIMPRIEQFLKAFISNLPQMISGLQQVIRRIIDTVISSISENGGTFAQVLLDIAKNAISNLVNTVQTLFPIIMQALQSFIAYMIEYIQSSDFTALVESILATLSNIFTQVFNMIVQYAPMVAQKIFDFLNTGLQNATALMQSLDTSGVMSSVLQVVTGIFEFLMSNLPQLISNLLDFLVATFGTIIQSIDLQAILQAIGDIVGSIIDALPDIFKALIDTVYSLIDIIIDFILNTDWPAVFAQLGEILGTLILKLGEALIEIAGTAITSFWDFITHIDWLALGQSIIDGIINGLAGFGDALVDTLTSGVTGGIQGLMDLLGIHSPSRVMYDIGQNITQGLINGLDSKQRELIGLTDDMSKSMVDALMFDGRLSASSLNAASFSGSNITNTNITQTYSVGNLDVTNNKAATNAIDELCSALQIYSNQKPTFA